MHQNSVECSHELCNCVVPGMADGADAYCTEYCRDAAEQGLESETCACGHPECDTP
jgi:hypothetical protein